jgi:uncharacterized protein YceK
MLAVLIGILSLGSLGCGTIITFAGAPSSKPDPDIRPELYGGVRVDAQVLGAGDTRYHDTDLGIFKLCFLLDLPLSLALDTATLPITIPIVIIRASDPEEQAKEEAKPREKIEEARRREAREQERALAEVRKLVSQLSTPPFEANDCTLNMLANPAGIAELEAETARTEDPVLKARLREVLQRMRNR